MIRPLLNLGDTVRHQSVRKHSRSVQNETVRRQRVWASMQAAARQAMRTATQRARSQGVYDQNWLGGAQPSSRCTVTFLTHEAWAAMRKQRTRRPPADAARHIFVIDGSGSLERPDKDGAFDGYPDLHAHDVRRFKSAAINTLLRALSAHLAQPR